MSYAIEGFPIKYGDGFLIHKDIAGNVDEFYSINERVECAVINLNKGYQFKIIGSYARRTSHDDDLVEHFYEDVELATK